MDVNTLKEVLSDRELEILECVCAGMQEKEIADKMNISPATVNTHKKSIRSKLHVNNSREMMLWYISYLKSVPFNLSNIRKYGIKIILVMVNVCIINDLV